MSANVAEEAARGADPQTSIPRRAQAPHHAQKLRMASFRAPVDKPHAVKADKPVCRGQPKKAVLRLRKRVNERGRYAVFVGPDGMRVLGKRLMRIGCRNCQSRKQDEVHNNVEGKSPTTC